MIEIDARELLPTIKKADLVLTDPPYDFSEEEKRFFHEHFMRIAPAAIVFSPPENQWILPAEQYLFWIKPTSTKNTSKRYSRFVEMIFIYGEPKWITGQHWSRYTNIFTDIVDSTSLHPFRKPPSLIERLVLNHTEEGDLIIDPFAGSGVVEEICARLNRRCISGDIVHPPLP